MPKENHRKKTHHKKHKYGEAEPDCRVTVCRAYIHIISETVFLRVYDVGYKKWRDRSEYFLQL
jgi:hypothetical protein